MVKFLNEAFNNKWPDWAKEIVANNWSIKQAVDIANVTVHTDFDKSYLKDPTKICFFKVETEEIAKRTWGGIYHTGIKSYYLVQSGDGYVYHDDRIVNENGRKQNLSNKAKKWVIENMVDFCWVDKYETDLGSKRDARRNAKNSVGGTWRRGRGQYHYKNTFRVRDEFGDYHDEERWCWSTPYQGFGGSAEDKSGYTRDPDKYIRKLNEIGQEDYAKRVEDMYRKVIEAEKEVQDVKVYTPDKLDSPEKVAFRSRYGVPEELRMLQTLLVDIESDYNRVLYDIAQKLRGNNSWDRPVSAANFYKSYKKFKNYLDNYKAQQGG